MQESVDMKNRNLRTKWTTRWKNDDDNNDFVKGLTKPRPTTTKVDTLRIIMTYNNGDSADRDDNRNKYEE